MLLEYDDNIDATRSTELSIVQVLDFPFQANCGVSPLSTHMNLRVLSKAYEAIESLAFHRVIALLRTDRNHEQKLVFTRLFALLPGRGKSHFGFRTSLDPPVAWWHERPEAPSSWRPHASPRPSRTSHHGVEPVRVLHITTPIALTSVKPPTPPG